MKIIKVTNQSMQLDGSKLLSLDSVNLPLGDVSAIINPLDYPLEHLKVTKAWQFGNYDDGVIEFVSSFQGGSVESGYYYGLEKPKSIIKVSSQIGCPASCKFCEAGQISFKRNLQAAEILEQAMAVLQIADQSGVNVHAQKHKINFAGTGEPLLNPELMAAVELLSNYKFSFKLSTVFPMQTKALNNFATTAYFARDYEESMQIQISLISTSEKFRTAMAGKLVADFETIKDACAEWYQINPSGRKINLSLILAAETPANPEDVVRIFPPNLFRFRFRPYVETTFGAQHLTSITEQSLAETRDRFAQLGYDVDSAATPTETEQRYKLASNVTLARSLLSDADY